MTTYASDPQASPRPSPAPLRPPMAAPEIAPGGSALGYEGEVVYMYAFDVAY